MKTFLFCAGVLTSLALPALFDPMATAQTKPQVPETKSPVIKLKDDSGTAIAVVGIPIKNLETLRSAKLTADQWTALFAVYVDRGADQDRKNQTAMLGKYTVEKDSLRFEPRFPLVPGTRYRAVFDATKLPGHDGAKDKPLETALFIPKLKTTPTVVTQVYPTRDDLPENQLKFYLHFSAPMSRGEAYANIKMLDADGKPVEHAFLELEQELWDPSMTRFTLLIDPGRIKQGLKPREDAGTVLEKGKTYTLVVGREWSDGNDVPLKESFKKKFKVVAPEEKQPDPKKWKLETPTAKSTKPLAITLGKSLDHALLLDCVWIEDDQKHRVAGSIEIAEKETIWRFQPKEAWKAGNYQVVVDQRLEDLAGNNVARPFEVDVTRPFEREMKTEPVRIAFEVK